MSTPAPIRTLHAALGLLAVATGLLLLSGPAAAVARTIRFTHPDPRTVDGFRVHLGSAPGRFRVGIDVGKPRPSRGVYTVTVNAKTTDGVVAVSAYNRAGRSPRSNTRSLKVRNDTKNPNGGGAALPAGGAGEAGWIVSALGSGASRTLAIFHLDGSIVGLAGLAPPPGSAAVPQSLRPARCDVDGDGRMDLVIGYGSGGYVEVRHGEKKGFAHRSWIAVGWHAYVGADGSTWPACGDLDGDGRDEIVVGLGSGGGGWLRAFDDARAGFRAMKNTPGEAGWLQITWSAYPGGATYPALGDFDGDGRDELAVGLGTGGDGWLQVFDDAKRKFSPMATPSGNGWLRSSWAGYNAANGELVPSSGDVDGDGRDEIVAGLGHGGAGWLLVVDDSRRGFRPLSTEAGDGWFQVESPEYAAAEGWTVPALVDVNGSGADEVLVGLGSSAGGRFGVFSDTRSRLGRGPVFGGFLEPPKNAGTRPVLAR